MGKDRFKEMQKGGAGASSFQRLAEQAATVAAIEKQGSMTDANSPEHKAEPAGCARVTITPVAVNSKPVNSGGMTQAVQFMRLPNPRIPLDEYNMVSLYIGQHLNMTRMDFVEMAILEKLNREGMLPDEQFTQRVAEIESRPRRGMRKGFRAAQESRSE